METPTVERGERIALLGVVSGFLGSMLAWSGTASQLLIAPEGPRLVLLAVVTVSGIVILVRPWQALEQLVVAGGGGLIVGIAGRSATGLLNAAGTSLGLGIYLSVLAGLSLLIGGGLDFIFASKDE
jgi:hypothetical protein